MKILVCGGSGFLGSHVVDYLTDVGHEVIVFDLEKSPFSKKEQKFILGDILDSKAVEQAMKDCDIVYNFAGIADMDHAKKIPVETVKHNIMGNTVILDACVKNKVRRFVFASTIYVYSNSGSFYRSSKQSCELIIENYNQVYGLEYTILRYGSLYGPRTNMNNWINMLLNQAISEDRIVRYGNGEEVREYIHVFDAARCSVEVLSKEYINQHVIITGNQQIKVKDLLIMIKEMMGNKIEIEYRPVCDKTCPYDPSIHYEITPYIFSPKLAKRIVSSHYIDLGQGILELLREIHKEHISKGIKTADLGIE